MSDVARWRANLQPSALPAMTFGPTHGTNLGTASANDSRDRAHHLGDRRILGIAAVAYVGAELLLPFLLHEPRPTGPRTDRSFVENGRVFCRVQRADIDVDVCVGCPHLRVMDGRGSFIVCDGRAAAVPN